eukprot:6186296-Pleurochrysis_carterae.AAC.4
MRWTSLLMIFFRANFRLTFAPSVRRSGFCATLCSPFLPFTNDEVGTDAMMMVEAELDDDEESGARQGHFWREIREFRALRMPS